MSARQLFISKRLVTEDEIFSGGVLVSKNGTIESVLTINEVNKLLASSDENIKVVDGGDSALLAGVVDSHVHVNEPGRTAWEGFRTATNAAAAGGITTIVDMPLNSIPPTTTLENLKIKAAAAKDNVFVDVGFWGGVIVDNQDSLHDLVKAGVVGFKCFLCPSGVEEFPNVEMLDLKKTFSALQGTGSVLAFHAELEDDELRTYKNVEKEGINHHHIILPPDPPSGVDVCIIAPHWLFCSDPEDYNCYLNSRPPSMEMNAVSLIMNNFIDMTDVRVHIVHVSSADVVPVLSNARKRRLDKGSKAWRGGVTAETCHHYLNLIAENIPKGHSEYKCAPPIRDEINKEKLWQYLLEDKLDLVVSDHSPCTPELKCSDNLKAWGGIASVQFGLSLFWSAASVRGVDLTSISKYLSSGPAQLCGLQNRKGAIKPGLDADLVFFDPEATFVVTSDMIRHKNKLTPYMGQILKGVVRETYLRGQQIYVDGEIIGEPKGKLLLNVL